MVEHNNNRADDYLSGKEDNYDKTKSTFLLAHAGDNYAMLQSCNVRPLGKHKHSSGGSSGNKGRLFSYMQKVHQKNSSSRFITGQKITGHRPRASFWLARLECVIGQWQTMMGDFSLPMFVTAVDWLSTKSPTPWWGAIGDRGILQISCKQEIGH